MSVRLGSSLATPHQDQQQRHDSVQDNHRPQQQPPELSDRAEVSEVQRNQRVVEQHCPESWRADLSGSSNWPARQSQTEQRDAERSRATFRRLRFRLQ